MLEDLGPTLLAVADGDPGHAPQITGGVLIYDATDDTNDLASAVALGVGLHSPEQVIDALRTLHTVQAVALVLRSPVPLTPAVRKAARSAGIVLLGLTRGASWAQLAAMLRLRLSEGEAPVASIPDAQASAADPFALANAIASLIDAPVTIEDRHMRVIAFSSRQDEADESRIRTILGRRVPESYWTALTGAGVFDELYSSKRPVHIAPLDPLVPGLSQSRVAIAVRAGDEILGSIWAAVPHALSESQEQALVDAAKIVALHLLQSRAESDLRRRVRSDLVSTALHGGAAGQQAVRTLGLDGRSAVVVALGHRTRSGTDPKNSDPAVAAQRERVGEGFAMHLTAVHPRSAAAVVGEVAYGLIPVEVDPQRAEQRAARIAQEFLDRLGPDTGTVIAIGSVADGPNGLERSRAQADRVLRVLRGRAPDTPSVAALADVHADSLVLEMRDLLVARGEGVSGPLADLIDHDRRRAGDLVETLTAWFDAFGDVRTAAAAVHTHPNTLRYRLRRIAEISGLDLLDPDVRFATWLQLRLAGTSRNHDHEA